MKEKNFKATIGDAVTIASRYFEQGKFKETESLCLQILAKHPSHVPALNILSLVCQRTGRREQGLALIEKSLQTESHWDQTHLIKGLILKNMGKLHLAEKCYLRALKLNPGSLDSHNNLSVVYQDLDCLEQAEEHSRKAVSLAPHSPEANFNLGNTLVKRDLLKEAIPYLEKAITQDKGLIKAYHQIANVYIQTGELEAARQYLENALTIFPQDITSHYTLSMIKTYTPDDPGFRQIKEARRSQNISMKEKIYAEFCLGKMYEDISDYNSAFTHFERGNNLRIKDGGHFNPERFSAHISALIKTCTPDFFIRFRNMGISDDRPVFIVGMPRSGTTLVEQILASHPDVHGAGELTYLGDAFERVLIPNIHKDLTALLQGLTAQQIDGMAHWYLERLSKHSHSAQRITDKMPDNFNLLWLAAIMFPNATIIHCRRNPLDTCISCYTKNFTSRYENTNRLDWLVSYYKDYSRLMDHWTRVLPVKIFNIQYEALVSDFKDQARDLIGHCGLKWHDQCSNYHTSKRRVITASAAQVRKPIYKSALNRWKNYEEQLKKLGIDQVDSN